MTRRAGDGSKTALIASLLLVSLVTAALLASQAHTAVTYHRRTAESVLRDYAALAAGEFIRRCSSDIGYRGYYTLIAALQREAEPREKFGPETLARLSRSGDERLIRAAGLARQVLEVRGPDEIVGFGERPLPGWLSERLASQQAAATEGAAFYVVHGNDARRSRSFVFDAAESGRPGVGFEVRLEALPGWFARAFERSALLPPSLGRGEVTNASLFVAVSDAAGAEVFHAGLRDFPWLGAELPFGDDYSGSFDGMKVRVSIDPNAAPSLVIGGLPRSRLPLLVGLLALITGLIVIAILQLRRERALAQLRSDFVSSVSHELRTPLTQIRMFAETLLLKRVRSEQEGRRSLAIIDKEARRLSHLVENVLRFSRSERGALEIAPELQDLEPLIRETVESFRPLVEGAGMRVRTQLSQAQARVDGDALRQVLLNLLDNAVKYGPRDQEILVSLESGAGGARLRVADAGPGVPTSERRRVFERFRRLGRERGSAVAGAGIGLSVVQDLVQLHRGRCWVEVSASGGACFVVELPFPAAESVATGHPLPEVP